MKIRWHCGHPRRGARVLSVHTNERASGSYFYVSEGLAAFRSLLTRECHFTHLSSLLSTQDLDIQYAYMVLRQQAGSSVSAPRLPGEEIRFHHLKGIVISESNECERFNLNIRGVKLQVLGQLIRGPLESAAELRIVVTPPDAARRRNVQCSFPRSFK
ncbi:hypothetical protein J6590_040781 [Homalodisca vitripennis]|nr:hypothetical protein J6590_040781 [Homalodisca vitripennis]